MSPSGVVPPEFLDLQIDYWTTETKQEMGPREKLVKKDSKSSLKSAFKSILVSVTLSFTDLRLQLHSWRVVEKVIGYAVLKIKTLF